MIVKLQTTLKKVIDMHIGAKYPDEDIFPSNAEEINNGFCADVAHIVCELLGWPKELRIVSDSEMMPDREYTHTFIEYNGLYFDAECIEGTDDWTQLPIFHRQRAGV